MTRRASSRPTTRPATAVVTSTRTARSAKVQPKTGEALSSTEENLVRMRHGLAVGLDTPLPSNAVTAALKQKLLEIELRAYEATGRAELSRAPAMQRVPAEGEPDAPRRTAKDRIIARLRDS